MKNFLWLSSCKEAHLPVPISLFQRKGIALVYAQWFQYMTFLFGLAVDQRELEKILVVISPLFCQKRVQVDFLWMLWWTEHLSGKGIWGKFLYSIKLGRHGLSLILEESFNSLIACLVFHYCYVLVAVRTHQIIREILDGK